MKLAKSVVSRTILAGLLAGVGLTACANCPCPAASAPPQQPPPPPPPAASAPEEAVHPGLYRRREGRVDLSTLRGPGFGYRIDEIKRRLPEKAAGFAT